MTGQFAERLGPGLILALVISLTLAKATAAQETIRIGYFDLPPHVLGVEEGNPTGAAIGYFEEFIAPHLGVEIVWDPEVTPPTRLMKQLKTGEKDAMIFLGWTEDRTAYLHYPQPYLNLSETLAFRVDHPLEQRRPRARRADDEQVWILRRALRRWPTRGTPRHPCGAPVQGGPVAPQP